MPGIDLTDITGIAPPFDLRGQEIQECYKIYRGQDGVIDYRIPVATMDLADTQAVIPDQSLPPNTIWHYIRRHVAACGLASPDSPVCIIRIDADGEMVLPIPNTPISVIAEQQAGGKFLVRWRYSRLNEEIKPTGFRIYVDSGGRWSGKLAMPGINLVDITGIAPSFNLPAQVIQGGFDFSQPAGTVSYGFGQSEFNWLSDAYETGQRCKFCIRSYADDGGETQNTDYISATADAEGPEAITGLYATIEQL